MISTLIRTGTNPLPKLDKYREEYLVDTETNEIIFPKVLSSGVISPDSIQNPGNSSGSLVLDSSDYSTYELDILPVGLSMPMYSEVSLLEIHDLEPDTNYYISLRTTGHANCSFGYTSYAFTTANQIAIGHTGKLLNLNGEDVYLANPLILHTNSGMICSFSLSGIFKPDEPDMQIAFRTSSNLTIKQSTMKLYVNLLKLKFK